jgi:hypothetical protein
MNEKLTKREHNRLKLRCCKLCGKELSILFKGWYHPECLKIHQKLDKREQRAKKIKMELSSE